LIIVLSPNLSNFLPASPSFPSEILHQSYFPLRLIDLRKNKEKRLENKAVTVEENKKFMLAQNATFLPNGITRHYKILGLSEQVYCRRTSITKGYLMKK
jgi:hypothetical protein